MRIIRTKLKSDVKDFLKSFCIRYGVGDVTFVHDVFSLVKNKGHGLPDQQRVDKMANYYANKNGVIPLVAKAMINKRKQILNGMAHTAMFQNYAKGASTLTPMEFTETLLSSFQKLHKKIRQSQCMTCHLLNNCDFGKQYGTIIRNITSVIDPDYHKKVNPSCPHAPEIDFANQMANATNFVNGVASPDGAISLQAANTHTAVAGGNSMSPPPDAIVPQEEMLAMIEQEELAINELMAADSNLEDVEEDPDSNFLGIPIYSAGKGGFKYDARKTGQNRILDDKIIDRLKISHLLLYQLSKKLGNMLDKSKKGQYKPVDIMTKDRKDREIVSISEAPKAVIREHAESNEVFDAKLAKKQLIKKQHTEPAAKRQLLYTLLDESSSMSSYAGMGGAMGYVTRAALAASFMIALSRRVCDDKGMIFHRGFTWGVSELRVCKTKEQHTELERNIAESAFSGGGTNIYNALKVVYEDITSHKDEISKAEILIITDACDQFSTDQAKDLRTWFAKVPLNVLDCVGGEDEENSGGAAEDLKSCSDNYFKVDPKKNTLEGMINLVGGKKKVLQ